MRLWLLFLFFFFFISMHICTHCISACVQEKLPPTVLMTGAKKISREIHIHTHTHCSFKSFPESAVKTAQLSVGGTHTTSQPVSSCICPLLHHTPLFVCSPPLPASVRALWLQGEVLEESQVLVWHGKGCLLWGGGRAGCERRGQAPRQAPPTCPH